MYTSLLFPVFVVGMTVRSVDRFIGHALLCSSCIGPASFLLRLVTVESSGSKEWLSKARTILNEEAQI